MTIGWKTQCFVSGMHGLLCYTFKTMLNIDEYYILYNIYNIYIYTELCHQYGFANSGIPINLEWTAAGGTGL